MDLLCPILAEMSTISKEIQKPRCLSLKISSWRQAVFFFFLQPAWISGLYFCKIPAPVNDSFFSTSAYNLSSHNEILLVFYICFYSRPGASGMMPRLDLNICMKQIPAASHNTPFISTGDY